MLKDIKRMLVNRDLIYGIPIHRGTNYRYSHT